LPWPRKNKKKRTFIGNVRQCEVAVKIAKVFLYFYSLVLFSALPFKIQVQAKIELNKQMLNVSKIPTITNSNNNNNSDNK